MELVTNEDFLAWAAERGVGLTEGYPKVLSFIPEVGDSRFWDTPLDRDRLLSMLTIMIDSFDAWRSMWVYKPLGIWTFEHEDYPKPTEQQREAISRWTGIPRRYSGAVRYDEPDRANLILLLTVMELFGGKSDAHVYFVPDHASQILWINQNYALFVFFKDRSKVGAFVERLASFQYDLPTDMSEDFLCGQGLEAGQDRWKYLWENPSWK